MKKIYLSVAVLALGSATIAQMPTVQKSLFISKKVTETKVKPLNQNKALGVTFWSNDFSNSADWVIDNASEVSPLGWSIGAPVAAWGAAFSGGITSTSGAPFAEMYNGDPTGGTPVPTNSTFTMTTTSSIDVMALAGTSNVLLQFEQFGALFQDLQEVQVSTDGTNFVTVGNNADDIEPLTQAGGSAYANPMLRSFNISSAISGNPTTVWIRFRWSPDVQNISYGWFIDDVALVTLPDNDLRTGDNDWGSGFPVGLHYYQIPLLQTAPIDFWSILSNEGTATQTNVAINVDVNTGAITGSSAAGVSIAAGAQDSIGISGLFTPSALGTYAFTWTATADLTDDVPANNMLMGETFTVTDYIYGRDDAGTASASGGVDNANGTDYAFEAGSLFDVFSTQTLKAIDVVIGAGTPAGTIIYGKLYILDNTGNFVYVDETAEYTTTAADAASGATITLELFTYPTVNANTTYLPVVGCYSEFYYGSSGFSPDQTSFIMYGGVGGAGSQYFTNGTPMVRMNFDPFIGIAEVSETGNVLGQNMPNPFDNNSVINFELTNTSDVQFEFVDMTGKVVKTMDLGTLTNGTHTVNVNATEFASGVYYYSLITNGSRITSKMVVQK